MKKLVFVVLIALGGLLQMNAQEADKFRFDFDLGYAIPQQGGGGISLYLEPKWNIKDHMSVGLRLGAAALIKELETNGDTTEGEIGANASYLGTFDYYFSDGGSSFVPFVGGGVGYYSVATVKFEDTDNGDDFDGNELKSNGKFGGMLRAGFNWGKFKMSLDYNLVGKSDLQDVDGNTVGTTKNGYFGISIGVFAGGGRWGR
ncbi:MAG: hypothetical protein ACSHXF_12190 [Aquaticitalea sp.]